MEQVQERMAKLSTDAEKLALFDEYQKQKKEVKMLNTKQNL